MGFILNNKVSQGGDGNGGFLNLNVSSGPAPYDSDALAWFTAVQATGANFGSSPASITSNKAAFNIAFLSLKSAGIWSSIQQACFLVGPSTYQGAFVNIKLSSNPTNNNFDSGDYNRLTGLKGNGTNKWLDSGISDLTLYPTDVHIYTLLTDLGTIDNNQQRYIIGSCYGGDGDPVMSLRSLIGGLDNLSTYPFRANAVGSTTALSVIPFGIGFSRINTEVTYNAGGAGLGSWTTETLPIGDYPAGFNYSLFRDPTVDGQPMFNGRSAFYSIGTSTNIETLNNIVATLKSSLIA